MALPDSVIVCECWARDGLQSIPKVISTDDKVAMINGILKAGFKKLEVTSFSNPKYVQAFPDTVEVLKRIDRYPDVSYVVLMPNLKGFERFEVCQNEGYGADEIILMISASEAHNKANFGMSHDEAKRMHSTIMERAHKLGVKIIGCPGTVYGCAIMGDVPMENVIDITRFYIDAGAQTIMLGDTTGAANPLQVRERIGELLALWPDAEYIAHFHDTRGTGIANSIAALELGLKYVDTSIGAIGGQPATKAKKYQYGFTGNVCTEDLVAVLEEMNVSTGVDMTKLMELGHQAEEIIGQPLRANVIRSGPVNHGPREYDPVRGLVGEPEPEHDVIG